MQVFSVAEEAEFDPKKHVEKILGTIEAGDVTVACWEPGQISPYHCHPHATEIYFCFEGGGLMRTPTETIAVSPGAFVVHPPGEVHEYANGLQRTLQLLMCILELTILMCPAQRARVHELQSDLNRHAFVVGHKAPF